MYTMFATPYQEATTVATKLVDEVSLSLEQLHSDQGRQFESKLVKRNMQNPKGSKSKMNTCTKINTYYYRKVPNECTNKYTN